MVIVDRWGMNTAGTHSSMLRLALRTVSRCKSVILIIITMFDSSCSIAHLRENTSNIWLMLWSTGLSDCCWSINRWQCFRILTALAYFAKCSIVARRLTLIFTLTALPIYLTRWHAEEQSWWTTITLHLCIQLRISFAKTLMIWTSFWTNTAEPISANVLPHGCVSCDDFQQTLKSNTIGSSNEQTD